MVIKVRFLGKEEEEKTLRVGVCENEVTKVTEGSISWDVLSQIHLNTARQIAVEGVNFRLHSPEIALVEAELNRIWLGCLHGKTSLTDFEAINRLWAETIRSVNKIKGALKT